MKNLNQLIVLLSKFNIFYSYNRDIIIPNDLDSDSLIKELEEHLFYELIKSLEEVLEKDKIAKIENIKGEIIKHFRLEKGMPINGFRYKKYNIYRGGFDQIIVQVLKIINNE